MERDFISQKIKEFQIKKHIESKLNQVGLSQIRLKKIPLGEKIIIFTSRPSLIVGSKGANIKDLTRQLKTKFKLENPQIEINEVKDIFLDANVVAERIVSSLERFGSARFKGVGHKTMDNVLKAGAIGVEIIISGKIPGSRAKNWRFYQGYLKKCGDISVSGVRSAKKSALLKSGIIGIKVSIMPPDIELPDNIEILNEPVEIIEEISIEKETEKKVEKPKKKPAAKKRKATKKKTEKVEKKVEEQPVKEAEKETPVEEKVEKEIKEEVKEPIEKKESQPKEKQEKPAEEPKVEEKPQEAPAEKKTEDQTENAEVPAKTEDNEKSPETQ